MYRQQALGAIPQVPNHESVEFYQHRVQSLESILLKHLKRIHLLEAAHAAQEQELARLKAELNCACSTQLPVASTLRIDLPR